MNCADVQLFTDLFYLLRGFYLRFAWVTTTFCKEWAGGPGEMTNTGNEGSRPGEKAAWERRRPAGTARWFEGRNSPARRRRSQALEKSVSVGRRLRRQVLALLGVVLCLAPRLGKGEEYVTSAITPPKLTREVRAVWVASVGNIDWPTSNGLTSAQQKTEIVALLDRAVELKLNTIVFQVRPACDAMYSSTIEPWSEYLTGTMGKAPNPFYDPLEFAIREAHQRGLELHAWFNPYRARHLQAKSPVAANHISRTHPEWVRHYGKVLWLDPGEKGVQEYSLRVVMDVVKRYDIDGVHFDDYFYPYPEQDSARKDLPFPDESSWRRYGAGGGLNRDDWRRQNVDAFVQRVYESIKAAKPWVKFGISPFGIWRPGNPSQIRGLDAFAILHADSRKWLAEGWVDYLAPQLYWAIDPPETSFPVLLRWWAQQNTKGRLLCPGLDSFNAGSKWKPEEIINQIRLTRSQAGCNGHMHWDMKTLMRNGALGTALERDVYTEAALVPACPWLERSAPARPLLNIVSESAAIQATWSAADSDPVRLWAVQFRKGNAWTTRILLSSSSKFLAKAGPEVIALTAIDRYGNASAPAVLEVKRKAETERD